ncbi:MAG: biotin/lipoyl-binding protein [Anaerolineae bacterium]|nr:biotin/lipoyl-binding protein [Anaerolineae bacterium]
MRRFTLIVDGERHEVEWEGDRVLVDGQPFAVEFPEDGVVLVNGQRHEVEVREREALVDGIPYTYQVDGLNKAEADQTALAQERGAAKPVPAGADAITAIMPGKIVQVLVEEGQQVQADQVVCVLEAMKMQNELRAPRPGTVREVRVRPGQDVEMGEVLVVLE